MADPTDIPQEGLGDAGTRGRPAHALLLHTGGESCKAALQAFLGRAETARRVLAVVSPATYGLIVTTLGPDATYEDATTLGRNPARVIPAIRRFVESRPRDHPVRVITEQWWDQRELAERAELARHEALANLAFAGIDVALVCLYDVRRVRPEIVADAKRTHPLLACRSCTYLNEEYVDPEILLRRMEDPLEPPPPTAEAFTVSPGRLSGLRSTVAERGHMAGLPLDRVEDLVLAVNELATNVVSHGNGEGVLQIWSEGPWLVCEVADRGRVDDPFIGTRSPAPEGTTGRGLWIVNQLCDLVELRSSPSGTAVRLRFTAQDGCSADKALFGP